MESMKKHSKRTPHRQGIRHRLYDILACALFLAMILPMGLLPVFASTIAEPGKTGSITIVYRELDETPIEGAVFSIRLIGEPEWNGSFKSLIDVPLNADTEPADVIEQAKSLESISVTTAEGGIGRATNLAQGLYLVVEEIPAEGHLTSVPFFATIPFMKEGLWAYDVMAEPKPLSVGSIELRKVLEGNEVETDRLFHFIISIDADGEFPVTFSSGETDKIKSGSEIALLGGQTAKISMIPSGTKYSVKESEANKDGYSTTSEGEEGNIDTKESNIVTFINRRGKITPTPPGGCTPTPPPCTCTPPGKCTPTPVGRGTPTPVGRVTPTPVIPNRPPQTGDTSNIWMYIGIAGIATLVATAIIVRRKIYKK